MRCLVLLTLTFLGLALGLPAAAQQGPGFRAGDVRFDRPGLSAALSGQRMEFFDGSTAAYAGDGAYRYVYAPDDPPFVGVWAAGEGGEVCVTFDTGRSRCDTYVENGGRLVLIIANGDRYPVRAVTGAE